MYFGGEDLMEPLDAAGLRIAYLYDDEFRTEYLEFEDMPDFDLLAASLPVDDGRQERAFGLTLRFLAERKPISFLMVGPEIGESRMLRFLESESAGLGYQMNVGNVQGGPTYLVGVQPGRNFIWPPGIVPRTEPMGRQEQQEGLEDEPQRRIPPAFSPLSEVVPVPAFGGSETLLVAVVRAVIEASG